MASVHKLFGKACDHYRAGRLGEAEGLYRQVIALDRRHLDSLHLLGLLAYQGGRLDEAAGLLERALAVQPKRPDILVHLGATLQAAGRLAEAAAALERAIVLDPNSAEAHNTLGVVRKDEGHLEAAASHYRRAIALKADSAEAHNNLAVVLHLQGRFENAEAGYRRALALRPDWAEAHTNLGRALQQQDRIAEAIERYRRALALKPGDPEALNNFGTACADRDETGEAVRLFHEVLRVRPDHAEALYNLARLHHRQGQLAAADDCAARALAARPDYADALNILGTIRLDQGRPEEAIACYRRALDATRDFGALAHSNIIFAENFRFGTDTAHQQRERADWQAGHGQGPLLPAVVPVPAAGRRLRVGYVSASFRHQAATYAFAPLLLNHDRSRFEVVCYSDTRQEDDLTRRLREAVDDWRDCYRLHDDQLAALVREDRIDILVDCVGHMKGNRLLVFARKPAPLQITAWGEPTGTGLAAMDCLLADPVLVPAAERPLFAERVVDLPCFLTAWSPEPLPDPEAPDAAGPVRFGSFNRVAKLTDATLALWARLLAAQPAASLTLKDSGLSHPEQQEALLARFAAVGGDVTRVVLRGGSSREAHFEAYRGIDVALDPLPHGGGMTTLDALAMGTPVLTLRGAAPSSRLAAAVLSSRGLEDWIAADADDYLARAAAMAADLPALRTGRRALRDRLAASPAGDPVAYTQAVEGAYLEEWRRICGAGNAG